MPDDLPQVSAFRAAAERRDLDGLLACFSPDAVVRSPVSARLRFETPAQLREVFGVVLGRLEVIDYYEELGDETSRVLFYRGRLAGADIEETQLIRLAPDGRIREIVFFIRPFAGLAGVAAGLAPALARARGFGPVRIGAMALFGAALGGAIVLADRIGARLIS
jgi:ketosteroid isomerase-like protein